MKLPFVLFLSVLLLFNNLNAQIIEPTDLVGSWEVCDCEDACGDTTLCELLITIMGVANVEVSLDDNDSIVVKVGDAFYIIEKTDEGNYEAEFVLASTTLTFQFIDSNTLIYTFNSPLTICSASGTVIFCKNIPETTVSDYINNIGTIGNDIIKPNHGNIKPTK